MTPKQTTIFEGLVIALFVLGLVGWFIVRVFSSPEVASTVSLPKVNIAAIDPAQVATDSALNTISEDAKNEGKYYGVPVEFPDEVGKDNIFE